MRAAIFSILVVIGCGDSTPARPDMSVDMAVTPDSSNDVAGCQKSVDEVRAACAAEDPTEPRLCIYDALRPLCATGRTAFVKAVFDCLHADACQTPSDPSGATACVQAAIHAQATANDHALGAALCACDAEPNCSANEPAYSLANLMMLPDADVPSVTSCAMGAGCPVPESCFSSTLLGPAIACP